ncbi:MAG TPA: hypothetical protein VHV74_20020 [Pseudonocardiaceae bacterium]|nr:hypothetical protein [Pseudonocardiaceae bacterium]
MDVLRPAAFWLRRMLHDTIVHHADATGGTGAEFEVAPDLAAYAITEWLELLSDPVIRTIKPGIRRTPGHRPDPPDPS